MHIHGTLRAARGGAPLVKHTIRVFALTLRRERHDGSKKDVYLAGGKLSWLFVAGAITLTNLSTDQLVGMNGNQMLLLAWWEISGFVGLLILAFVFVPIYYRARVTTVTELLEQRYGGGGIRTLVSTLFLFGMVLIYLPAGLYSGALFLKTAGIDYPLLVIVRSSGLIAAQVLPALRELAVRVVVRHDE